MSGLREKGDNNGAAARHGIMCGACVESWAGGAEARMERAWRGVCHGHENETLTLA